MKRQDIEEIVISEIEEITGFGCITGDCLVKKDLDLDSLDVADLSNALGELVCDLDLFEAKDLNKVSDIVDFYYKEFEDAQD